MTQIVPRRIMTAEEHAAALHGRGRGTVAIAQRINNRWNEHTVSLEDLRYVAGQLAGQSDVYLSQNWFLGRRRAIASLAQLNALFTDLDYYQSGPSIAGLRPAHILPVALEQLDECKIPAPTIAISTGRGIALIWMHSSVPRSALARWQACQRVIYKSLSALGADPRALDAARVLRLIGTENSKSETLVMPLTGLGHIWDFDALADEILPLKRAELERLRAERAKAQSSRRSRSVILPPREFNFITLAEGRLTDLQSLRQYRFMGPLPPGQRDEWMFCAGVNMAYLTGPENLSRELTVLAAEVAGWDEAETKARMSAVQKRAELAALGERITFRGTDVDPRYRMRNETIIERLAIIEEEMRGANLRHLITPDMKRERERARGERRRREAGAIDRRIYEANSLSQLRPWEAEGISRRTWERRRSVKNT